MVAMRSIKIGIVAVGLTAGSCGAYWGAIQYQGNFHAVKEGAFYRSAQLSKDELQSTIREHRFDRSSICGALIPVKPGMTKSSRCRRRSASRTMTTLFPPTAS